MILQAVRVGATPILLCRNFQAEIMTAAPRARKRFISFVKCRVEKREGNFLAQKGNCELCRRRFCLWPSRIRPLLKIPVLVIHHHARDFFGSKWQFTMPAHGDDAAFARHHLIEPAAIFQVHGDDLIPRSSLFFFLQAAERLRRQRYHALHNSSMLIDSMFAGFFKREPVLNRCQNCEPC
jgi:hypothetical protein